MLARALLLAAFAAACIPAALALAAARWPSRSPAAAILLWQAIGLGWGLGAVGALAGLGSAGSRTGVAEDALALAGRVLQGRDPRVSGLRLLALTSGLVLLLVLCLILVAAFTEVLRARRRQRLLLSLLAHGDPKVPGALVVDHPAAAAYCVPGLKSKIVISAGALDLLDSAELAAVLAHERAHLRERHDLVLLPFTALLLVFRWNAVAREANAAVGLLVEMLADDRALRHRPARELATALLRVGAAGGAHAPAGALAAVGNTPSPPGALAAVGGQVSARVSRLLRPAPRLSVPALALIGLAAVATVAVPVAFLALPF